MVIRFNRIGRHVGTRFAGESMRKQIVSSFKNSDNLIFDFSGVESISLSFADECFGKLTEDFKFDTIKNKTSYKNISPSVKAVINSAFKERLSHQTLV
jgi:hypothetical protein